MAALLPDYELNCVRSINKWKFNIKNSIMLKPLEQFICDKCSNVIEKPEEGWIEWLLFIPVKLTPYSG
jgi:hypothetical protein